MTTQLDLIEAEVCKLPPADRAKLLDHLVASLDVDAEIEAAWDALADEREQALLDGTAVDVPLDQVMTRLRARFSA